ncbi:unnamed protein product [Paramecium primaurelia]|uniref:Uncharacterized protein n=1 Tax=Paramecium primaurelia TaxID=5886 RepID=A0A8S1JRD6_PARPR|nr:unnamed protein product [Paramecium primaurelia]
MNCDCVPLRSELENIRNKQSILLRDHQMQLELIKQKLKNNMKVYCTKQGYQKINEQGINKLKEIIVIKNSEIEILIHTNQKYRAQLNQEEQISNLKIQNLKKESQDIVSLNIIQQGEINKFKLEQPQREDLLNEQYQLRLEEIQNYYSQFLKLNGKEKYKMLNKQDELMQKEKVLNEQINNQFSLIQLLEIEQLDKISIINYNEKDLQKFQIDQ